MKTSRTIIPTAAEIIQLFEEIRKSGAFFGAHFVKKDGTIRTMNCRTGVKKGVKGIGLKYDPKARGYLTVWDRAKKDFRTLNGHTIIDLTFGGIRYVFLNNLVNLIQQNQLDFDLK